MKKFPFAMKTMKILNKIPRMIEVVEPLEGARITQNSQGIQNIKWNF